MKKLFILLTAVCLLALSCKKDSSSLNHINTDNGKKYKVTLTIPEFTQTIVNMSARKGRVLMARFKGSRTLAADTSALAHAFSRYFYVVYDATGNEVKRIIRYASDPTTEVYYHEDGRDYNTATPGREYRSNVTDPYSVITDSLAAGTYTVFIAGSNDEIEIDYSDTNYSEDSPAYYPYQFASNSNDLYRKAAVYVGESLDPFPQSNEIFLGKCKLTVGSANVTDNITVNRIVGQLEVNIEDAISNNVAYLAVVRDGENEGYSFYNDIPFGYTTVPDGIIYQDLQRTVITATDHGTTNFKTYRFVLNTLTPFTVKIIAVDASNNIVAQTTVNNVRVYKNQRTILTGRLFGPASTTFSITAHVAWDPDINTIHF